MAEHVAGRATTFDKVEILEEHMHSLACVYPTLAAGVLVESDAVSWTLGGFVEIIPANTIGEDFDVHWMNIEGATVADVYELVIYAAEVEISRKRFTVSVVVGNKTALPPVSIQMQIQPKNTQIQTKVASAIGGSDVTISFEYHTY